MSRSVDNTALQDFERWIAAGMLPELSPTHQERSLRNAYAMLCAGRELLRHGGLEELSIEGVCQLAGTTTGAFYGRFSSKEAFFVTLQRLATIGSDRRFLLFAERHAAGSSSLEEAVAEVVQLSVDFFRADVGVLRASLQHTREGMWQVLKKAGDRYRLVLADTIAPMLPLPRKQARVRAMFAYQAILGVLIHAILIDPGPMHLDDESLPPELVRLAKSYLAG
jgi:AcrR family transcriptional regulator